MQSDSPRGSSQRGENFVEALSAYSRFHRAQHWSGTFGEFLRTVVPGNARQLARTSHEYLWDMLCWFGKNSPPNATGAGATNGNGEGNGGDGTTRARRILTGIAPRAWEHPADKAALQALRRLPVFDEILRKLFGFFGEKPIRLAFQANAVRVSPNQFPRVNGLYEDVLKTLDAPRRYNLFISQTPIVNAGAYGMDEPFIILNSGTVALLDDDGAESAPGSGSVESVIHQLAADEDWWLRTIALELRRELQLPEPEGAELHARQ